MGVRIVALVLLIVGVALAKDEALHNYLKGADVPLVGLLELNNDLTEELLGLLRAAKDPKVDADLAGRRARLRAMAAKNEQMGKLIEARQSPASGKELKLSLTRGKNRTDEALQSMQKALDGLEGLRAGGDRDTFVRLSDKASKSVEAQRIEVERAAELYKKLAVKALL